MKIIITESQYKMLLESNTDSMQSLIDMAFDQIKENCEGGYYIRSHQNLICDPVDMIEEIKVVDVSKVTSMDYFEKNQMDVIHNIRVYDRGLAAYLVTEEKKKPYFTHALQVLLEHVQLQRSHGQHLQR
jgi:hypothetical protein